VARILIAPDSFKGSATSHQVCDALARGWLEVRNGDEIESAPFADGGEGTLDCIESVSASAVRVPIHVQGATGIEHSSSWLLVNGDTAVIEMAALCGITTVEKLDPLGAHSFGVGQAIKAALNDDRVREILVAVGGSASTDGGTGALAALGFTFLAADGSAVGLGGAHLHAIKTITPPDQIASVERGIKVLVDVQSPLIGATGAAHVFAPQKGADAVQVDLLDIGLAHLLSLVGVGDKPGYGAAGGVSFGLSTLLGASIVSGVHTIAAVIDLEEKIQQADCVITGEGSFDSQSFSGKVVGYIAEVAQRNNVPLMIACGVNKNGDDPSIISLVDLAPSVESAKGESEKWLIEAGKKLAARFHH
jgi:glycerate kinase